VGWVVAVGGGLAATPVILGTALYGVYRLFAWYGTQIDPGEW
jgi:hypothetical protein